MKTHIIIATAIAGLVANAAVAAPSSSVKADAGAQGNAGAASSAGADNKRYCIVETPTGSRLPRKQCQTRAEWASQGVDIDAPSR